MANKGPNTNQSQWFITLRPAEHLNDRHVVFGRVQSGFEVIEMISQVETDPKKHRPIGGDEIVKIVHCGELELKKKVKPITDKSKKKRKSQLQKTKTKNTHKKKKGFMLKIDFENLITSFLWSTRFFFDSFFHRQITFSC